MAPGYTSDPLITLYPLEILMRQKGQIEGEIMGGIARRYAQPGFSVVVDDLGGTEKQEAAGGTTKDQVKSPTEAEHRQATPRLMTIATRTWFMEGLLALLPRRK